MEAGEQVQAQGARVGNQPINVGWECQRIATPRLDLVGASQGAAMSDVNMRLCSYCDRKKVWVWNGQKLKDGSKIYTDGGKRRWAGRRCPDCERTRVHTAVHCDQFERQILMDALAENGFSAASSSLPLRVSKDGECLNFGIKRARVDGGGIILESAVDGEPEMVALVFETVRLFSRSHIESMIAAGKITIAPAEAPDALLPAAPAQLSIVSPDTAAASG